MLSTSVLRVEQRQLPHPGLQVELCLYVDLVSSLLESIWLGNPSVQRQGWAVGRR
jgi:hypothetical protein